MRYSSFLKQRCLSLLTSLAFFLLLAAPVSAYNFDFSGVVLYDSQKADLGFSFGHSPGRGDQFSGSLNDENLDFANLMVAGSEYHDFGALQAGAFTQNGLDYYYAFSQGDGVHDRMGMIWWDQPRSFVVTGKWYEDIYGIAFYLEGSSFYTPAQLIADSLLSYLDKGYLNSLTEGRGNSLHYWGCQISVGTAFLGLLDEPQGLYTEQPSSAVPLPAGFWFLGSGLLFLFRRRRE